MQANRGRDNNALFGRVPGQPLPVEGYRVDPGMEPTYGVTLKYRFGDI